jgi:hypothetical protein
MIRYNTNLILATANLDEWIPNTNTADQQWQIAQLEAVLLGYETGVVDIPDTHSAVAYDSANNMVTLHVSEVYNPATRHATGPAAIGDVSDRLKNLGDID